MAALTTTATSLLLVSSASVLVLLLASSVTVYFYSIYARPEALVPDAYEHEISDRVDKIGLALDQLKKSYMGKSYIKASEVGTNAASSILVAEPVLPKNPVTEYFENLDSQIQALNAQNRETEAKETAEQPDQNIEAIKFLPKSATLEKEIKDDPADAVEEPTDKVIVKQVGLSLGTPKIRASVYRIQNIFSNPGINGHLYMFETRKSDWDRDSLEKVSSTNFSSTENLEIYLNSFKLLASNISDKNKASLKKVLSIDFSSNRNVEDYLKAEGLTADDMKSLESALKLDFSSMTKLKESLKSRNPLASGIKIADKKIEYICFNCPSDFTNFIKYSIKPEEKPYRSGPKDFVDPYKWLYLATKIKETKPASPIIVIAYPYNEGNEAIKRIIYPSDVNLFPVESLSTWDISIYEADEQRIINHCKKMLDPADIEAIDKINK